MATTTTAAMPVVAGVDYPDPPKSFLEAVWWAYTATVTTAGDPDVPSGVHLFSPSQERYDARYGYGAWGRDFKLIQKGLNYVLAYHLDPDWNEIGPSITVEDMGNRMDAAQAKRAHESDEDPFWVEVVDQTPPFPKDAGLVSIWKSLSNPIARRLWEDRTTAATADPLTDLGARYLSDIPNDPPPPLVLGRLHPTGHTILYGEGGVGKGTQTSWWIVQLTRQGHTVLILDYENHPEEWGPRIHALGGVAKERVVHVTPNSEVWKGARGALWDNANDIKALADAVGATYLVVDSIVAAIGGADAGSGNTEAPAKYSDALILIGRPCLSLGHVNKANDLKYPFGSVYWHNFARITWSLKWSENRQSTILEHRKHNNYSKSSATVLTLTSRNGLPADIHEKARAVVIADMVYETLTEPMKDKQIVAALNADLDAEDEKYKIEAVQTALRRGIKATAKLPQRFSLQGELWSRYEGA